MQSELTVIGFEPYNKKIFGYTVKYKRGNELVFIYRDIIRLDDIRKLEHAFSNYDGNIYIVLNKKQGVQTIMDIAICRNLYPLELNPTRLGRWNSQGTGIEWVWLK